MFSFLESASKNTQDSKKKVSKSQNKKSNPGLRNIFLVNEFFWLGGLPPPRPPLFRGLPPPMTPAVHYWVRLPKHQWDPVNCYPASCFRQLIKSANSMIFQL